MLVIVTVEPGLAWNWMSSRKSVLRSSRLYSVMGLTGGSSKAGVAVIFVSATTGTSFFSVSSNGASGLVAAVVVDVVVFDVADVGGEEKDWVVGILSSSANHLRGSESKRFRGRNPTEERRRERNIGWRRRNKGQQPPPIQVQDEKENES